jgi:hypothetical protein
MSFWLTADALNEDGRKSMAIDRSKLKTLDKLKDKGFDTANKIKTLDGRLILKNNLTAEMGNIFELQDAIKANHSELAWLMDGEDPKPSKKEEPNYADDDRSAESGVYTEAYEADNY